MLKRNITTYLERRGGSWPNFLRRISWYMIPTGLALNVARDLGKFLSDGITPFLSSMFVPLAVSGSFLLLAQTAASIASIKRDETSETFGCIASNSFSVSLYILPIGWIVVTYWNLLNAEHSSWWSYFIAVLYLPSLVGCILNYLDMNRSLEEIMQACIRLRIFNKQ